MTDTVDVKRQPENPNGQTVQQSGADLTLEEAKEAEQHIDQKTGVLRNFLKGILGSKV